MKYIYVSCLKSKKIFVWEAVHSGKQLNLLQIVDILGHSGPMTILFSKRRIFIGVRYHHAIISYYICEDGFLINPIIYPIEFVPTHLNIDYSGKFLYCSSYQQNCLSVYFINDEGNISHRIQVVNKLNGCHFSYIIPNINNLLLISCLKDNFVKMFYFNLYSGKLYIPDFNRIYFLPRSGPRHMIFSKLYNVLYIINEISGTVCIFKITNDIYKISNYFIYSEINMIPKNFSVKPWLSEICITPNNRFLYCCDRYMSIIICYNICNNGMLLKFNNYYYTEFQPRSFSIDDTGSFLVVAGQKSNFISLYEINNKNGKLYFLSKHKVGKEPVWVSIL